MGCSTRGVKRIILGICGSATNDGGAGMAQALGIKLFDQTGNSLPLGGSALAQLHHIDLSGLLPELADVKIIAACDVENPLTGPTGAAAIFAPQKGATPEMVTELDAALDNLARVIRLDLGRDVVNIPGAGAAGGLGAGLLGFLGAELQSGFTILADILQLEPRIAASTLVVTGEGNIDKSTVFGKVPTGIARIAKGYGVPVIAIGGGLGVGAEELYAHGLSGIYPSTCRPMSLDEAMHESARLVTAAARNALELVKAGAALGK
ncbi:MAG TPA: glycerate kinase [Desulfobacteria bacterium]|nr:glycerate kinase [Desulfobacteria bacterium]